MTFHLSNNWKLYIFTQQPVDDLEGGGIDFTSRRDIIQYGVSEMSCSKYDCGYVVSTESNIIFW